MRILGLDVGEKRIGVAKVDSSTKIAVPVGFILTDDNLWNEINRLARINNTSFFVLGLPRNNNGEETKQSFYVRKFAKTLTEKVPGAKIRFQDESLTSVIAEDRLKKRKKSYDKGEIDAEAATIILQDFIENFKEPKTQPAENTNLIKKEMHKVKRETKRITTWVSGGAILVILALLATGGGLWIKKKLDERQARQEYFAQQEAEMKPEVFNFTILPGETIFDVKKNLARIGYSSDDIDTAFNAEYDYDFLRERPEGASLEGYLYAETHEFYKSATVQEILNLFLKEMGRIIEENDLRNRYAARGLSLFEGITLASVVQKEASPRDQPTVAQVFLSRLSYGMSIGSDVTVSYALDVIDPERTTYRDNSSALLIDSCYNTRLYAGLPCGPISNPGLTALLAVADPSETSYLYFLTGDDGVMYYGYTEAEHIRNRNRYCSVLCNVSL